MGGLTRTLGGLQWLRNISRRGNKADEWSFCDDDTERGTHDDLDHNRRGRRHVDPSRHPCESEVARHDDDDRPKEFAIHVQRRAAPSERHRDGTPRVAGKSSRAARRSTIRRGVSVHPTLHFGDIGFLLSTENMVNELLNARGS